MRQKFNKIFNIFTPAENLSISLFNSEGFYWLTTATAIAFAAEELGKFQEKFPQLFTETLNTYESEPLIKLFQESIKKREPSDRAVEEAKLAALSNLKQLVPFARKAVFFEPAYGLILGKTYATFSLIYKLIELEWQQILNLDEVNETYLFLDTVIEDHKELEKLEQHCLMGKISKDDLLYLRSHWERVRYFWINFGGDLQLLAEGYIKFRPPYRKD
ncbi:MAG: hypothetical protein GXW85_01290 [Clostridia bacterium]|nr:hypothetical protein [Clostridia bacterium]